MMVYLEVPGLQVFPTLFLTIFQASSSMILREKQCNLYDAEFSKIFHHRRLVGNILELIDLLTLRDCLTKCLHHPNCHSVNYMRRDQKCELMDDAFQLNITRTVSFAIADEWNHFETNYNRKTVHFFLE